MLFSAYIVPSATMITFSRSLLTVTLLLLLVATIVGQCRGDSYLLRAAEKLVVPINEFYCSNLTRGQTWVDWKTRVVELPKQHIAEPDSNIVIDYFVKWPWYLKGMRLMVCNSIGHRPNISWPVQGYSPVTSSCSTEDQPRCPVGLEIYMVQYQSWWPWH